MYSFTTALAQAQTKAVPAITQAPALTAEDKQDLLGTGIIGLVLFLSFILWVWALVHILRSEFKDGVTKLLWFLFVFFLYGLGSLVYLLFGRPKR